jgi:hypothetical protein
MGPQSLQHVILRLPQKNVMITLAVNTLETLLLLDTNPWIMLRLTT